MNDFTHDDLESLTLDYIFPQMIGLPSGSEAITRELFDEDFWWQLPRGTRRRLGRILKRLVKKGRLPLRPLGPNAANHQRYRKL